MAGRKVAQVAVQGVQALVVLARLQVRLDLMAQPIQAQAVAVITLTIMEVMVVLGLLYYPCQL